VSTAAITRSKLPVDASAPPGLSVDRLTVELGSPDTPVRAVNRVSLVVPSNRILVILGESGSGKSMLLKALAGIAPTSARISGRAAIPNGVLVGKQHDPTARRRTAMVFQNPLTSLDPSYTVGRQIEETLRLDRSVSRRRAKAGAVELLADVHLPNPAQVARLYPYECSGGMRQRIVLAIALASRPSLLLADEPTTALDLGVQARVLSLIAELHRERRMATIVVTHDIAVAKTIADDVAVMYAGRVVEYGALADVLDRPRHPYTRGLLAADISGTQSERPVPIPGAPPPLAGLPDVCAFAPRCGRATEDCWASSPTPRDVEKSIVACYHPLGSPPHDS
jgi:peptide/nickel transport system ATP-binding protein